VWNWTTGEMLCVCLLLRDSGAELSEKYLFRLPLQVLISTASHQLSSFTFIDSSKMLVAAFGDDELGLTPYANLEIWDTDSSPKTSTPPTSRTSIPIDHPRRPSTFLDIPTRNAVLPCADCKSVRRLPQSCRSDECRPGCECSNELYDLRQTYTCVGTL